MLTEALRSSGTARRLVAVEALTACADHAAVEPLRWTAAADSDQIFCQQLRIQSTRISPDDSSGSNRNSRRDIEKLGDQLVEQLALLDISLTFTGEKWKGRKSGGGPEADEHFERKGVNYIPNITRRQVPRLVSLHEHRCDKTTLTASLHVLVDFGDTQEKRCTPDWPRP